MKRQHWYHCTEEFHGPRWSPRLIVPKNIPKNEPPTPRLCVAANVVRCFAARLFQRQVHIYRTEFERRAVKPKSVADACLTQERWLIPPVAMIHIGTIEEAVVHRASEGTIARLRAKYWLSGLTILEKMYGYRESAEVLYPEHCTANEKKTIETLISWWEKRKA